MFYRFPAMRGIQANSEYFVCMIPLGVLSKILSKTPLMYYLNFEHSGN